MARTRPIRSNGTPAAGIHPFEEEVSRFVRREGLFHDGDTVVVGVSGGADSTALLHSLAAVSRAPGPEVRLVAAHLDHGLREESAEDAEKVRALARDLDVPFRLGHARSLRKTAGVSAEATARRARYAFYTRIANKEKARAVALAHHKDDRIETVLHRLLQGATLQGLAGIPLRRPLPNTLGVEVVRPFFERSRAEIVAYLRGRRIRFLEDPTNWDGSNARSRLRHRVLPTIFQEYSHAEKTILRMEQLARDATRILDREMKEESDRFHVTDGTVTVPRSAFDGRTQEGTRRVLETALESLGVKRTAPPHAAVLRLQEALVHKDGLSRRVPIHKGVEALVGPSQIKVRRL